MTKVTVTFDVPGPDDASLVVMAIEDNLPDDAENFEWDAEG
jgi:hypothetical protein